MATSNNGGTRPSAVVLVGIDFTDSSLEALKTAENLARAEPGSELHLVHAFAVPTLSPDPQELFAQAQNLLGSRYARARGELDKLAAEATNGISRVTSHLRLGSPAAAMSEVALDIGADLIVIGADHHTGMHRLIFGSAADRISRTAPCPVLIVRPKTVPVWERIEPMCPDCAHVQRETHGAKLWCERHSQHRIRPHTYHESPLSYGVGSMTFRPN